MLALRPFRAVRVLRPVSLGGLVGVKHSSSTADLAAEVNALKAALVGLQERLAKHEVNGIAPVAETAAQSTSDATKEKAPAALKLPQWPVANGLGLPSKYGHFINGQFVEPSEGKYFENPSPIDGRNFIKAARGTAKDVDAAVDAATAALSHWRKVSVTERSNMLLKIADIIEANAERLAKIETVDNGKAVRECKAADIPLCIDHFRYFAGVIRAEEGSASEIDANTLSLCIHEPLGVVGQIMYEQGPNPRTAPLDSAGVPGPLICVHHSISRGAAHGTSRC